jgi:hypothetical protein
MRHIREGSQPVNSRMRKPQVLLLLLILPVAHVFAQKVTSGYDKSVDFSYYKSYTWHDPGPTQTRPLLYATVAGTIRSEVEARGLTRMDKDGDLTLIVAGGLDYGLGTTSGVTADSCSNCQKPLADPREWTGKSAPPGISGAPHPKGALELQFVDRTSNKVVWSGTVTQKLDPDKKQKSLDLAHQAVVKLLAEFPPKK